MSEYTFLESMYKFCRAVIQVFAEEYLRESNAGDTTWLLSGNELRGFPGMLPSNDCMHWEWKKCALVWQGNTKVI
jgi:hypothetical protein